VENLKEIDHFGARRHRWEDNVEMKLRVSTWLIWLEIRHIGWLL
jgi:hypothetical protein